LLASHWRGFPFRIFDTGVVCRVEFFKLRSSLRTSSRHQTKLLGVPHAGTILVHCGLFHRIDLGDAKHFETRRSDGRVFGMFLLRFLDDQDFRGLIILVPLVIWGFPLLGFRA
jgi:hypothetical protein